jgi:hypothetical protein
MSEFGKAFAAARERGDLKFKFKGKDGATKEYTTDLKGENRRAMYDSTADTAKFTAERDKPRTGGANIPTPQRKAPTSKPIALSEEARDNAARSIGAEPPSKKRKADVNAASFGASPMEALRRIRADMEPKITSLSYDEAKRPKPSQGRTGRGALAAGGKVTKMAKGGMSCMKRGGGIEVKGYKKGGMIDGCAQRGKTKGKVC